MPAADRTVLHQIGFRRPLSTESPMAAVGSISIAQNRASLAVAHRDEENVRDKIHGQITPPHPGTSGRADSEVSLLRAPTFDECIFDAPKTESATYEQHSIRTTSSNNISPLSSIVSLRSVVPVSLRYDVLFRHSLVASSLARQDCFVTPDLQWVIKTMRVWPRNFSVL